jgi:hypothetical protein
MEAKITAKFLLIIHKIIFVKYEKKMFFDFNVVFVRGCGGNSYAGTGALLHGRF